MNVHGIMLGKHFSLAELIRSDTALRRGIDNVPNADQIENLERLVEEILDPIREMLGTPVVVNSGFRCPALIRLVGGSGSNPGEKPSAHMDGRAADIVPLGIPIGVAFDRIRKSALPIDKVILECNAWIHVQVARERAMPRRIALTASGSPGAWRYHPVEG